MALDGTYSGLKASVADFLSRGDLTAAIGDFVRLAESQIGRRFAAAVAAGQPFPRRLMSRSDASLAADQEFIAVPPRFLMPRTFHLTTTDPVTELSYLSPETFLAAKRTLIFEEGDAPKYYTVIGGEFQILPVPPIAYTAELAFLQMPEALSDSVTTNWLLQDHPDIYLYGALTQSAPYLDNDGRVSTWGTLFTQAVSDASAGDPLPTDKSSLRSDVPSRYSRFVRTA